MPPISINTLEDLRALDSQTLDYILMRTLDFQDNDCYADPGTNKVSWTEGTGWAPISGFSGHLIGNGFQIVNLFINRPLEDEVGLFGATTTATLEDVVVEGSVTGRGSVGLLGGWAEGGCLFDGCEVYGSVNGNGWAIGGMVGYVEHSWVDDCFAGVGVNVTVGSDSVGGLIGYAWQVNVDEGHAEGDIQAGLGGATTALGGLVGVCDGMSIANSTAKGSITAQWIGAAGGLIGSIWDDSLIFNCEAEGNISEVAELGYWLGGFVGSVGGVTNIYNCIARGTSTGAYYQCGGFYGESTGLGNNVEFISCRAYGDVVNSPGEYGYLLGGFGGDCTRIALHQECGAEGNVIGEDMLGGFVAKAGHSSVAGGIYAFCYAKGNVTARFDFSVAYGVGGFFYKIIDGTAIDCYARGDIVGWEAFAGFVGESDSDFPLVNCYSTGLITDLDPLTSSDIGGFIGATWSGLDVTACFYDTTTSGQSDDDGRGEPKTTAEMQDIFTFSTAGWDIVGVA